MFYEKVNRVSEIILECLNDRSVRTQAMALAQYLLLCERRDVETIETQLRKPGAIMLLRRMLECESEFMGPIPRAVGIDIVSSIASDRIQKSLDVKHIHSSVVVSKSDRVIPIIKLTILHSHPSVAWIRFRAASTFDEKFEFGNIVDLSDNIYELYVHKMKGLNMNKLLLSLMHELESKWRVDLIFCSELIAFQYNPLLFLSNYVKFMWCNITNNRIFDPKTYDEIRLLVTYLTYGLLFINNSNLSNMSEGTHQPLIAYTGERPKSAMSKFKSSTVYAIEGTRSMQTMDMFSDNGTKSNYIEIVSRVQLEDRCLDRVV